MARVKKNKKISWLSASQIHPFVLDSEYDIRIMTNTELDLFMMSLTWSAKNIGGKLVESNN
jgi:hypothetical protein